jgi:hypothetical protein
MVVILGLLIAGAVLALSAVVVLLALAGRVRECRKATSPRR